MMSDISLNFEIDLLGRDQRRLRRSRARSRARRRARQERARSPALLATLGKMSPDERKTQGAAINAREGHGRPRALLRARDVLKSAALDARLAAETIDVTLPRARAPAAKPAASIR